jgi:membrane protein required for colicin V production
MTWFDGLVLTILIASVIISTVRGLVNEILSLCAWFAAAFVANTWAADLATMLPHAVPGQVPRLMLAFGVLFIGTLLVAGLVNMALRQLIKVAGLSLADRGLGGLFGLARGVLIVLTLVILAGLTSLPHEAFWRDALLSPLAETAVRTIKPMLPPDWSQYVHF